MDKPKPKLETGKFYIHEDVRGGGTKRLLVFEVIKLTKHAYDPMFDADPNIDHAWTEFYEVLYHFQYFSNRYQRSAAQSKEKRTDILRNQDIIYRSEPLKDNLKRFFDKVFELKENLVSS